MPNERRYNTLAEFVNKKMSPECPRTRPKMRKQFRHRELAGEKKVQKTSLGWPRVGTGPGRLGRMRYVRRAFLDGIEQITLQ